MSIKNNPQKIWAPLTWLIIATLLLSGCGGTSKKVYHVGILAFPGFMEMADGFKAEMTELGYIEGENITYDLQLYIPGVDSIDSANEKLQKFISDGVDLIYAFPTEQAELAKAATEGTDIPVVFAFAGLEGTTLVKSVREPGGNITGVRFSGPESTAKRLELLHQLVPNAKRIGYFYQKDYPTNAPALEKLRPVAAEMGLSLVEIPITSIEEMQADMDARAKQDDLGMDAILQAPDALTHSPDCFAVILKFVAEHKLPLGAGQTNQAPGALFAYSPYNSEVGALAAPIADKVLKGTPAGTIPVASPENHLVLNHKVAQELGLTIPQGLLRMADEIIQ
ncbi:MAG: ABC transporter substrate-binding protein [Anaerolineales bacterium]|nr:ABC transporter substrate-binding protein [Anaerolineales bacterium]